jgi:predicted DNA-binding transcriptional regulator AlpA
MMVRKAIPIGKSAVKPLVEDKLLTPKEVAALLGLKEITLASRRCRTPQDPPYVKYCGQIRYPQSQLEQWLRDQQEQVA